MTSETRKNWPDEELLPLTLAARIAGRSYDWAHSAAIGGRLNARRIGGRTYVTATSFFGALDTERLDGKIQPPSIQRQKSATHLRLVVDNTRD